MTDNFRATEMANHFSCWRILTGIFTFPSHRNFSNHAEKKKKMGRGKSTLTQMMHLMAGFSWKENIERLEVVVAYGINSNNIGQELECFQFIQV